MNNIRKLLIGALVSLAVAGLFVFIVYQKMQTGKMDAARMSRQWRYVAASRNIAAGERLTANMLTTVDWTSTLPVDGAIGSPEKAVGRLASFPIASGMVVTEALLAAPDSALGLPQKIPDGMRAIAIQTDEVADFGGFLFPGSQVDVLMTIKSAAFGAIVAPTARGFDTVRTDRDQTVVVLEDISVLATGKQMVADPSGKPTTVSVVTLLVTPDDARKVALAQQKGVVHLALRNSDDRGSAIRKATYLSDLIGAPPPQSRPFVPRSVAPTPAEPTVERLEIVTGSKSYTQTYHNNIPVGEALQPSPVGGNSK
jgi:pilus assembly protein CpaB